VARSENNGWDFVKVGETYQYKEEIGPGMAMIAMVKILEDNSSDEWYSFLVEPVKVNKPFDKEMTKPFTVGHAKNIGGIYSGMPQFYETPEYFMED